MWLMFRNFSMRLVAIEWIFQYEYHALNVISLVEKGQIGKNSIIIIFELVGFCDFFFQICGLNNDFSVCVLYAHHFEGPFLFRFNLIFFSKLLKANSYLEFVADPSVRDCSNSTNIHSAKNWILFKLNINTARNPRQSRTHIFLIFHYSYQKRVCDLPSETQLNCISPEDMNPKYERYEFFDGCNSFDSSITIQFHNEIPRSWNLMHGMT